jgi:hypothetical protein
LLGKEIIMKYAIVRNGQVQEERSYKKPLKSSEIKHINGIPMARPLHVRPKPQYDMRTEKLVERYEIFDNRVEVHWNVEPLTPAERVKVLQHALDELEVSNMRDLLYTIGNVLVNQLPQETQNMLAERDNLKAQLPQTLGG